MNLLVTAACPKSLSVPAPPERLFLRRRGRYLRLSLGSGEQLGQWLRGCLPPGVLLVVGGACNGPEVGKQPGKIERLCFAWGPTIHPPTIIGLSVRTSIHLPNQFIHPCVYYEFKHHPLVHLPNPSTPMSIHVSVCPCPPYPFISPSILPYKPIFPSVCLSVLPCVCCSFGENKS